MHQSPILAQHPNSSFPHGHQWRNSVSDTSQGINPGVILFLIIAMVCTIMVMLKAQ